MKKIYFLLFTLLFIYINNLNAQRTFVLHGVNVPYQNQENFESQEIEYNSKLAQDYVDSGKMRGWALLKRVQGIGDAEDYKFNYFWVHAFDNIEQMVAHKKNPFWEKFEDKFGFKSNKLKGNGATKSGMYHFMTQDEFNNGQGKYIILNDGKVNDVQAAIELGKKTGNIFKKNSKKTGMTGWGVATIIPPQDKHNDSNIFYWDIYDSLEGVMKHMANQGAVSYLPGDLVEKFLSNLPDGFSHRNITEIIIGTSPKQ